MIRSPFPAIAGIKRVQGSQGDYGVLDNGSAYLKRDVRIVRMPKSPPSLLNIEISKLHDAGHQFSFGFLPSTFEEFILSLSAQYSWESSSLHWVTSMHQERTSRERLLLSYSAFSCPSIISSWILLDCGGTDFWVMKLLSTDEVVMRLAVAYWHGMWCLMCNEYKNELPSGHFGSVMGMMSPSRAIEKIATYRDHIACYFIWKAQNNLLCSALLSRTRINESHDQSCTWKTLLISPDEISAIKVAAAIVTVNIDLKGWKVVDWQT